MDGQYYNFSNPKIKKPHLLGGLKLYPVCLEDVSLSEDIMLLDDLMDKQEIQAFEVSEEGSVQNIGLKNLSHFHTLVIDGEAVIGAKQNRIAQTTMVLAPNSETVIPVNCVERGRWNYSNDRSFQKSEFSISPKMRDKKADLLRKQEHHNIQGKMWEEIDMLSSKVNNYSNTDDLGEVLSNTEDCNINNLEKFYNDDCNGYIVFGTERPFLELFFNNNFRKHHIQKNFKSWMADVENQVINHADPKILLDQYLSSEWEDDISVGLEKTFKTNDDSNGRSHFFEDKLIHSYYFF